MDQNKINDKMRLKRLELQLADSNAQKQKIRNALTILKYERDIEELREKIQRLRDST